MHLLSGCKAAILQQAGTHCALRTEKQENDYADPESACCVLAIAVCETASCPSLLKVQRLRVRWAIHCTSNILMQARPTGIGFAAQTKSIAYTTSTQVLEHSASHHTHASEHSMSIAFCRVLEVVVKQPEKAYIMTNVDSGASGAPSRHHIARMFRAEGGTPVHRHRKFSAVRGTTSLRSSITIRPALSPAMLISMKTLGFSIGAPCSSWEAGASLYSLDRRLRKESNCYTKQLLREESSAIRIRTNRW